MRQLSRTERKESIKPNTKMKYIYSLIIISLLSSCFKTGNNQTSKVEKENLNAIKSENIIGSWNFIETRDINGKKLDNYEGSFGTVQATGPKLIYKANFTYEKVFTPKNTDIGNWKFNSNTNTIEHDLYIDSTDFVGKDLIRQKLAIKSVDGKYYERIEDRIIKMEKDEMLIDNRGLVDVYKKEKK
jgi:hypothetical protein